MTARKTLSDARRQPHTENDLFLNACVQSAAQEASLEQCLESLPTVTEKTHFGMKATIRGEAFKGWFADQRQSDDGPPLAACEEHVLFEARTHPEGRLRLLGLKANLNGRTGLGRVPS
jgi:hypothetical protein